MRDTHDMLGGKMQMNWIDISLIVIIILGVLAAGLYFLNKWASKKAGTQQNLIDKNKQTATIYVIDKKKDYAKNINLPKAVSENLPKIYRFIKMNFIQAKIGPQIMTLMCDKKVFEAITPKKNIKVELAGIYIISVKGMKSSTELKELKKKRKDNKLKEKQEAKMNK